jgi:hypothetical protein
MSPLNLREQLAEAGRRIAWWRARLWLAAGAAGILLFVWLFSLLDVFLRYGRVGRTVIGLLLWAAVATTTWWVLRLRGRTFSSQSVAAMIEKAFPRLDNHLINYLQFAGDRSHDAFKQAYVRRGLPEWSGLNLGEMRDRRAEKRARLALLAAAALLAAPLLFLGPAWTVAVWRVVNPFSSAMPATLTRIVSIEPGDATVLQGSSVVLNCTVRGRAGHRVWVDVEPSDKEATTYPLGRIGGAENEKFSHRLAKVGTRLRYRFRAGDAAFPAWHTLETRPPLAFSAVGASIQPPAYTGLAGREADGLAGDLPVPAGSTVDLTMAFNLPVSQMTMLRGKEETPLASAGETGTWRVAFAADNGAPVSLIATGREGDRAEQLVRIAFEPDRLPEIDVIAPEGRPVLGPGAVPEISFAVSDDFGLSEIAIEQIPPGSARETRGEVVRTWKPGALKSFAATWKDERPHRGEALAYRILARDNAPQSGEVRVARSAPILFNTPSAGQAAKMRDGLEQEALSTLARVIDLQRQNLTRTKAVVANVAASTSAQWMETSGAQEEIRRLTRQLLGNPLNPLGNMAATVNKLYLAEMTEVIPLLASIPGTEISQRPVRAESAVNMEEKILRQLTRAEQAAGDAKVERRVSALSSMLEDMIKRETAVQKDTQGCVERSTAVGETLVGRQDDLALDVTEFVTACRSESAAVKANDTTYSALLEELAGSCEEMKVRADMTLAGGKLEANKPAEALPPEAEALRKLALLLDRLDEVRAKDELAEEQAMLAAIEEARNRFEKMADIQRKAMESMEMVDDQKDKSSKDVDTMEEEYEELLKNMEEALLQVPTDLNIFMDLNVANDIVEDVFSVFEEIQQAEGSENLAKGDVKERALAKREEYLAQMEEAKDRLDDMEKWLADKPDSMKITAEAFDQEEMPKAGIALGALATEAEDLIGDLLEKDEDMAKEADDGAINTAVPDMVASDEVKEGDVTSFAAQGASGNETPDHKEQDGRSNVGRQGMAVGETAAGSGTINAGDTNIEARRTQDPTQSGQIDVEGDDVKTKATGGGKLGTGKGDEFGMEGGVKRMDSTEEGSGEGLDALLAKRADALYAKASTQNIRADSIKAAAHHLRQANDAVARGDIAQLKESRRIAVASLRQAKAQIDAAAAGTFAMERKPSVVDDAVEAGPDAAPPQYRDLVAEYYKSLNEKL